MPELQGCWQSPPRLIICNPAQPFGLDFPEIVPQFLFCFFHHSKLPKPNQEKKSLNIINKGGVSFELEFFKLRFPEISWAASKEVHDHFD